MWHRRYITSGTFLILTIFFHVPKGYSYIRLVYELTACILNEALWDPKLWMPFVDNFLNTATQASWFGDVDSSEMLHKYKLSEKAQTYSGVDVSWTWKRKALRWERWTRMAMGLLSSPFATTRTFAWETEVIMGDSERWDKSFLLGFNSPELSGNKRIWSIHAKTVSVVTRTPGNNIYVQDLCRWLAVSCGRTKFIQRCDS